MQHASVMDEPTLSPGSGAQMLAVIAVAPMTRVAARLWWVGVSLVAALAYLDAVSTAGLAAPVGGAVFIAGMCAIAVVARNASAEAHRAGSVQRGSLMRAAGFGVLVHGGLLAAVGVLAPSALITTVAVVVGGVLVALTRPTTLAALGIELAAASPATGTGMTSGRPAHSLSTPELVAALRESALEVRQTTDPTRKAELAELRGSMIAVLAERSPEALRMLLDDTSVRPSLDEPDSRRPE